ncbi:MAG TPA: endolytic transglycosylase MltG [Candidatus Limnocylindrales bacterium]|nr:endolytic transglycosylase MltG [Candidatus Limnocylindrales bacterium]
MSQAPRGPIRGGVRVRAPRQRSAAGPLAFVLLVVALLAGTAYYAQPLVIDAVVEMAEERDTLLRQPAIRAIVGLRVGDEADLAADPGAGSANFEVASGETAGQIARRLEEAGFVRRALAFTYVLYASGRESALQAGTYRISPAMTPREIASVFERATSEQAVLRIIEGWRLTEIAAAVEAAFPDIPADAFLAAAVVGLRTDPVLAGLPPETPLEGFLYPDTYFFEVEATAEVIIDTLLDTFERRAGAVLRRAAVERETTVYDLVKLASLVEREARDRAESATIAGVYANRLEIGMKLDADPTIQYAIGEWRELLLVDLELESPYNTYLVAGLPPTPICNPGLAALEGAAAPEEHDYFFFVADPATGTHVFAVTLEEHEANRVRVGNR